MRADFINEVSKMLRIDRRDLIEKDLILHRILLDLSRDKFFSKNFLFKGGTCLIKCYLGYFRFSEDIDFTWKKQKAFKDMSQKKIRRYLSEVIDRMGEIIEGIASKRMLDFKCHKANRNYVELGGGNKTVTFKMWYESEVLKHRSFVKLQFNFVEKLIFPGRKRKLKSLLSGGRLENLEALYPEEFDEYSKQIAFDVYDTREILCEKVRSILTRRGIKARDFVDLYLISKEFGFRPETYEKEVVDKIRFIIKLYSRYRNNLNEKKRLLKRNEVFVWGNEKSLLLSKIDEKEFYRFLKQFTKFLKAITEKVEGLSVDRS